MHRESIEPKEAEGKHGKTTCTGQHDMREPSQLPLEMASKHFSSPLTQLGKELALV